MSHRPLRTLWAQSPEKVRKESPRVEPKSLTIVKEESIVSQNAPVLTLFDSFQTSLGPVGPRDSLRLTFLRLTFSGFGARSCGSSARSQAQKNFPSIFVSRFGHKRPKDLLTSINVLLRVSEEVGFARGRISIVRGLHAPVAIANWRQIPAKTSEVI